MDRISKFIDQGVTGVTNKVTATVSTIKRDFTRLSKRRKQEKKDKKQKKLLQNGNLKNRFEDFEQTQWATQVEHKYKLVCDVPNCQYHPKPNAYEDFLNTLWNPKSNRASITSSQIIVPDDDKKSNLSIEKDNNKENLSNLIIGDKLVMLKDKLNKLNYNQDDKSCTLSTNSSNLDDIFNEKNIKLTITNENGETTTVDQENLNNELSIQQLGKCSICTICFNKLKSPLEIMACNHVFHKNCISQWLEIKLTCPLCNCKTNEPKIPKYKRRWSDYNVRID